MSAAPPSAQSRARCHGRWPAAPLPSEPRGGISSRARRCPGPPRGTCPAAAPSDVSGALGGDVALVAAGAAARPPCPSPVCVGDGVVLPPGSPPSLALPSTATPAVPPRVTPERRSVDGQSTFREYPGELVGLVAAPARRTELAREERDRLLLGYFLRLVSWQPRELGGAVRCLRW